MHSVRNRFHRVKSDENMNVVWHPINDDWFVVHAGDYTTDVFKYPGTDIFMQNGITVFYGKNNLYMELCKYTRFHMLSVLVVLIPYGE